MNTTLPIEYAAIYGIAKCEGEMSHPWQMSGQYKPHVIEEKAETGIERHWREQEEQQVRAVTKCSICYRLGCLGECMANMQGQWTHL